MKKFMVSLDRLPEVFQQSQGVLDVLTRYRVLLGQPEVTGTECEEYAKTIIEAMGKSRPTPKVAPQPNFRVSKPASTKGQSNLENISQRISAGRQAVASGARPKLVDAIAQVMGNETLNGPEILRRLKKKEWEPGAANQSSYISYTLSDNKKVFARVKRGFYRVKHSNGGLTKASGKQEPGNLKDLDHPELLHVLQDINNFPTNLSIIQVAPVSIRASLSPKSSRDRLVNAVVKALSPEKK